MSLNRVIGLPMLTFYGTGMILGAGIYSIIGQAAGIAGESLWIGFLLAAVAAFLTALSYAELATMFPTAGGEYIYLKNAFPKYQWVAGSIGILIVFAGCASVAAVALSFSNYLQNFTTLPIYFVACSLLILFTGINILGIKQSSWLNAIFTLIEIGGLTLFIWLGSENPEFGKALLTKPGHGILASSALIIFAYFGFENIVNLVEETKNPEKNIPRALFLSLFISTVLYILVSLAAVALMPAELLSKSNSALTDAAVKSSQRIASVLGGVALFSTANTVLIGLITTSRIIYGMAKEITLPQILAKVSKKRKTPWMAGLLSLIIALLLLPFGTVTILASISSFVTMFAFAAINVALIVLRFSQVEKKRPFQVPFTVFKIPVFPVLAIVFCILFVFQFDRIVYLTGLSAIMCSIVLYYIFYYFRRRHK